MAEVVRCLSFHCGYVCRHAGACCTSGWPIPIERTPATVLDTAIGMGRLRAPVAWLRAAAGQPVDVAGVLATHAGACIFYDRGAVCGCQIQTALGHDALPTACQHFPRRYLLDDRGAALSLSHYCPTAAWRLFDATDEASIGHVTVAATPEGFDARGTWPPLLRPGVLMDFAGYDAWEAHLVETLAGRATVSRRHSPERTLARLAADARQLAAWQPGVRLLADEIAALRSSAQEDGEREQAAGQRQEVTGDTPEIDWEAESALVERARAAVIPGYAWQLPAGWRDDWERWVASRWPDAANVVGRYLAAHAFASWYAYLGDGVVTQVHALAAALAVLRLEVCRCCRRDGAALTRERLHEAIRQADLVLVHLIEPTALAAGLNQQAGR